jgi:uncharacterized phiE125 gp8 family phage protein
MQTAYTTTVVTAPTAEPVSLREAKQQCGIEFDETYWDDRLNAWITAAREMVEGRTNRSFVNRSLKLTLPRFPIGRERIVLPRGPVRSVTTVAYTDAAGDSQTVTGSQLLDGAIYPAVATNWPSVQLDNVSAVQITYAAGDTSSIPVMAKQAILLLVHHWFQNRSATAEKQVYSIPMAVDSLINQLDVGDEFLVYGT